MQTPEARGSDPALDATPRADDLSPEETADAHAHADADSHTDVTADSTAETEVEPYGDPKADTSVDTEGDTQVVHRSDGSVDIPELDGDAPPPPEGSSPLPASMAPPPPIEVRPPVDSEPAAASDPETIPATEIGHPDREHEHPEPEVLRARVTLPPTLSLLLGIAGAAVAIAALRSVSGIVAPTFLAITLIIALNPLYQRVRRVLPRPLAGLVLIISLYGIVIGLAAAIGVAVGKFGNELADPRYRATFTGLVDDAQQYLLSLGVEQEQINRYVSEFDWSNLTGLVASLANTLTGVGTMLLFLLTVTIFLVMDAGGFGRRLEAIHRVKPDLADSLVDFGQRVRRYWVVSTIFGLIVAVIDYVALLWLGVPMALTFGVLAFVTNYIPNIGFVIGLVPPALIGLLSGGVSTMVWVIAIYCVANFVIQTILQPKFTGDAVGINPTTAFLSLMVWGYVFGALGALMAIPCTLLVKCLLIDRDPNARWLNQFIASEPREGRSAQPL